MSDVVGAEMRALVWTGPREAVVQTLQALELAAGEVLVEVA